MTMSLLILLFATLACFGLLFFFRHYYDSVALISVAIGAAINANIYNSATMPITAGWLIFGIDSMLYTLFMFTVIWRAKDYNVSSAKSLTVSTVIAIIVSAIIEMFATWSFQGALSWDDGQKIIGYVVSAFATVLAVWVMLWLFRTLEKKKKNAYLEFILCIWIASIIHSLFYHGLMALISWEIPEHALRRWVGSFIVRSVCVGFGCLLYYLNGAFWNPRNLEVRYRDEAKKSDNSADAK
jgi:hypothetical protein